MHTGSRTLGTRWTLFSAASTATMLMFYTGWFLDNYFLYLSVLGILSCISAYRVWTASTSSASTAVILVMMLAGQWWFWRFLIHQIFFRVSGFAY